VKDLAMFPVARMPQLMIGGAVADILAGVITSNGWVEGLTCGSYRLLVYLITALAGLNDPFVAREIRS
jgi:hypothetical protein